MRLDATQLLARYQHQLRVPQATQPAPTPKPEGSAERPAVSAKERAFIDELLSTAEDGTLPDPVAELAKGRNVDLRA
ncbi:MAG: hypothetical protein CME06_03620 [Gemmatimonadetes bacterium]|nr:hypothetical protein [Gemmatimonadota bacterium]